MEKPIKVAVIDDDDVICTSLSELMSDTPHLRCATVFANAEDALCALPGLDIDVVLMDIGLPGINGTECIRQLRASGFEAECVMMTVFEDDDNIYNALLAGANGYIVKSASTAEILEAIEEAYNGGAPMSGHIARRLLKMFRQLQPIQLPQDTANNFTRREYDIIARLAQGFTYKEIATELFLSAHTIRTHIHNIYKKLQVNSRKEMVDKLRSVKTR